MREEKNERRMALGRFGLACASAAGDGANDPKWLLTGDDPRRQRRIRRLVRQVLAAGEEPNQSAAPVAAVIPHRASQGRVGRLQGIDQRSLGDRRWDLKLHFLPNPGQIAQVVR